MDIEIYELKRQQLINEIKGVGAINIKILNVLNELQNVYSRIPEESRYLINITIPIKDIKDLIIDNIAIPSIPFSIVIENCSIRINKVFTINSISSLIFIKCNFISDVQLSMFAKHLVIDDCKLFSNFFIKSIAGSIPEITINNLTTDVEKEETLKFYIQKSEKTSLRMVTGKNLSLHVNAVGIDVHKVKIFSFLIRRRHDLVDLKMIDCEVDNLTLSKTKFNVNSCINDTIIGESKFENCSFEGYFSFINNTFIKAPNFSFEKEQKYPNNIIFQRCTFEDYSEDAAGRYRLLKDVMASANNEQEETRFAGLEMRSRDKTLSWKPKDFFEKICSMFALLFNNYGMSISRPLFVLFLLVISGTAIFCNFPVLITKNPSINVNEIKGTWAYAIYNSDIILVKSTYYSMINCLGPINFFLNENLITAINIWGQSIAVFQGIISSILWYLLIVGVKKRFRQH